MSVQTPLDPRLLAAAKAHPYRLLFCTISGAHLYGFPSADSDYDLRGIHLLPVAEVVGLKPPRDTVEHSCVVEGMEIDLVTHDAHKFIVMMLKRNGYVLEQLLSPLLVLTSPEHEELRQLATGCITRHHAHHYLGFAETQWRLFEKDSPPRVKPLLYVYRVLLTGIHLMRTGRLLASLPQLNEEFRIPYLGELIQQKVHGTEKGVLAGGDPDFHRREYERLRGQLEEAYRTCGLPDTPSAADPLHHFLLKLRLQPRA